MKRVKRRALQCLAIGLLAIWLGGAAWYTCNVFDDRSPAPVRFLSGLLMTPVIAGVVAWQTVSATLWPQGATTSFPVPDSPSGYVRWINTEISQPGASGEFQVRATPEHLYFAWPPAGATEVIRWRYRIESIATVTAAQWNAAVPGPQHTIASEEPPSPHIFTYRGKQFRPSGERWPDGRATAVLSPDGEKLAIVTFAGPTRPHGLYFFYFTRRWWDLHWEIFDASSGARLMHASTTRVLAAGPPRIQPAWGNSRTLLVGMQQRDQSVISVCVPNEPRKPGNSRPPQVEPVFMRGPSATLSANDAR